MFEVNQTEKVRLLPAVVVVIVVVVTRVTHPKISYCRPKWECVTLRINLYAALPCGAFVARVKTRH